MNRHKTAQRALLVLGWVVAVGAGGMPAWAAVTVGPLAPPDLVNYELVGHVDNGTAVVDSQFPITASSHVDLANSQIHMDNQEILAQDKLVWMHLTFLVPPQSGWNPTDPQATWPSVTPSYAGGVNGTVTVAGQSYALSGSSLQFLEIWQRWWIHPQPGSEVIDFGAITGVSNPPQLTQYDVATFCPEPATLGACLVPASLLLLGRWPRR
jgi:hypothetical protein